MEIIQLNSLSNILSITKKLCKFIISSFHHFIIQGIEEKYDQKKLAKAFKKEFNCNGTVVDDEQYGEVIQLSGDQRNNIQSFLADCGICKKDNIVVHGF